MNNNNNNKAFSLIELSIVLIIISLLVAGIIGGQSLIESAKIKNLANEIDGWRKALLIFKAKNDRWPGDLDNDGFNVGWCGGNACRENETYKINSFPAPYNNKVQIGDNGPYIELYLSGLSNFRPDPYHFVFPSFQALPDFGWLFHRFEGIYAGYSRGPFLNFAKPNTIWGISNLVRDTKKSSNRILLGLDKKFDDGDKHKGNIRVQLSGDSGDWGARFGFMLTDL